MSDSNSSTPPAPTPAQFIIQAPATQAAPAKESNDEFSRMSPKQFKQRLEDAHRAGERAVLKDLGVEKGDRKEAIKAIRDKQMTLAKRDEEVTAANAKAAALQPIADEASALKAELRAYADEQFATLPEALQKFIAATSSEDPANRLKAMRAAREAGLVPASATATAPATPAAPAAKPANPSTTMADSGPPSPKPAGVMDHYAKWQSLRESGQTVLASMYYAQYGRAIENSRSK